MDAARLRLEEAFEKSCFGQAQRESYAAFASQDVSEEALRDLEAAIKDVEGYFEAHSKLLTLVNKHRTLMKKVVKMAVRVELGCPLLGSRCFGSSENWIASRVSMTSPLAPDPASPSLHPSHS